MKRCWMILLALGILFFFDIPSQAIETGKIQGFVTDENGERLPGIKITAESPYLQGKRSVLSSNKGDFHIPLLPAGKYILTFKLEGFGTVILEKVVVRLGRVTDLVVKMRMSEIQEEIVIIAPSPLIDKTSVDTSYLLNRKDLDKIPSQGRSVTDVVKFTPGVTGVRMNSRKGTAGQGQPSFRGEGEEGNNWIVDGLSISGVRLRNSGMHINYDSLEEIQIISDHFSPEYGSSYGGIINMVTKSGSNDFSGEFSLIFRDKNLQAKRTEQLSLVSESNYFSNYDWYLNAGGPIIKDKLWFFISNNLFMDLEETKDGTIDYFFIPGGKKSTYNNNIFAKFSLALTNSHSLSLTSIYDKSFGQNGGIGIPDLYEEKNYSDSVFRINYKGILNSSTFIEAGIGYVKRKSLTKPLDGGLGPAQYYIEDLARNINNVYGNVTDDQERFDLNVKLSKYLSTETFGRHELNMGLEYYSFSANFGVDFSGKNEDLFPGDGFDIGTKYYFDSWQEGTRTPTFLYEYGKFEFINSARGFGLYFMDKISFGRFTVMAGLRSQTQLSFDDQGKKLWSWGFDDFLSPRLSLAVDITGDGNNILKLGWGRFSDLITTMPLGLFNSGAGLTFRAFFWQGLSNPTENEIHDPSNWSFSHEQNTQTLDIAEGIKPNFLSRYMVEFDRRIGKNWAFIARYIETKATDLLEVLALFDINNGFSFLYDNFEHKRRNYHGFEFELHGEIGSIFFLNASYSLSSAKGTNPGQTETGSWAQEEGSTNYLGLFGNHLLVPDTPELQATKAYFDGALGGLGGRGIGDEGWYGKLPYSVDHDFKLNTIFLSPWGFSISTAFEWISGYYWEKLGYVPFFGGYYSFPERRGTRETPSHFFLDLGIEKEFHLKGLGLPESMGISLRVDIFNVFDSQKPLSFIKEDIPIFGQVWGRQQPRAARFMVKIRW